VRCTTCGTLYADVVASFDPTTIYGEAYFEGGQTVSYAGYGDSAPVLEREFARSLAVLRRWVPSGRLLEVGAAYGLFLRVASRHFVTRGLDVSAAAATAARRRGLDVEVVDLCTDAEPDLAGPWDAAVLLDTVEHLRRPLRVLRRLHDVIRPGGAVLLTTGDAGSTVARLCGRRWRLMTPPEHLFFFDRATMTRLLERAGFEVVLLDRPWKLVPVGLIVHRLLRRWAPGGRTARRLVTCGVPLNLFDTMRVVAIRAS
jgi:SAM-dependent methyltransferase